MVFLKMTLPTLANQLMSQMCTGAGDYFRTSKPHSEKLWPTSACRRLQPGEKPRKGLLGDYDIFVKVRLKLKRAQLES